MYTLTIAIVLGVVVILLIVLVGAVISRKRASHAMASRRRRDDALRRKSSSVPNSTTLSQTSGSTLTSTVVEAAVAVTETQGSVQQLEARLLVRFSGSQELMRRNREFERKRNPHLSETALLEKMLYDLERGR